MADSAPPDAAQPVELAVSFIVEQDVVELRNAIEGGAESDVRILECCRR